MLAQLAGTPAHAKIVVGGGVPDRDLDFGAVSVNAHAPMSSELPHGGFGSSGYGKDLGMYGLDDYTRIKHVAHAL